jgi:hypothetical protein
VNDSKNVANYTEFMGQAFIDKCQPTNYNCSTREEIENIIKWAGTILSDGIKKYFLSFFYGSLWPELGNLIVTLCI